MTRPNLKILLFLVAALSLAILTIMAWVADALNLSAAALTGLLILVVSAFAEWRRLQHKARRLSEPPFTTTKK